MKWKEFNENEWMRFYYKFWHFWILAFSTLSEHKISSQGCSNLSCCAFIIVDFGMNDVISNDSFHWWHICWYLLKLNKLTINEITGPNYPGKGKLLKNADFILLRQWLWRHPGLPWELCLPWIFCENFEQWQVLEEQYITHHWGRTRVRPFYRGLFSERHHHNQPLSWSQLPTRMMLESNPYPHFAHFQQNKLISDFWLQSGVRKGCRKLGVRIQGSKGRIGS